MGLFGIGKKKEEKSLPPIPEMQNSQSSKVAPVAPPAPKPMGVNKEEHPFPSDIAIPPLPEGGLPQMETPDFSGIPDAPSEGEDVSSIDPMPSISDNSSILDFPEVPSFAQKYGTHPDPDVVKDVEETHTKEVDVPSPNNDSNNSEGGLGRNIGDFLTNALGGKKEEKVNKVPKEKPEEENSIPDVPSEDSNSASSVSTLFGSKKVNAPGLYDNPVTESEVDSFENDISEDEDDPLPLINDEEEIPKKSFMSSVSKSKPKPVQEEDDTEEMVEEPVRTSHLSRIENKIDNFVEKQDKPPRDLSQPLFVSMDTCSTVNGYIAYVKDKIKEIDISELTNLEKESDESYTQLKTSLISIHSHLTNIDKKLFK